MAGKKKATSVVIPEGCERLVDAIRIKYPNLSLARIVQAMIIAGAEQLSTAEDEALKDALLKA